MKLKELEPGDIFVHAKSKAKAPAKFLVLGKCEFNRGHGSSTRMCQNLEKREIESKSCRMEVNKVGESIHKQKFLNNHVK